MDAIVIGAGLSGLAAANRLVNGGLTVTLIDARNRVGGRVFTSQTSTLPVELGAEWVGNTGIVHSLLKEAGASVVESDGRYLRRTPDGFRNAWDPEDNANPILKRATCLDGPDRSFRSALTEIGVTAEEARAALMYVEGFHAADPDQVGIRWLAQVEETQSAAESSFRCVEGVRRAVIALGETLGATCDVRLETAARAVRWGPYGVEIDVESLNGSETLNARSAIITLPLPLLSDVRIDPPIPDRKEAASLMQMGDVAKVVFEFRDRFWEETDALRDMLFVFTPDGEFPTVWAGPQQMPVLAVWAGGPRASRICKLNDEEVITRAMGSLAGALGISWQDVERQLVRAHFHNWTRDEFSRGAYTYVGVGGVDAHAVLARPIGDALFFAGEATIGGGFNATMEGAARSGFRAADELLAAHAGSSPVRNAH